MGLLTDLRRSITRLWGRTEHAVGEATGNQALEFEGDYDETKIDAEEAAEDRRARNRGPEDPDDGLAGAGAR